MKRTDYLSWDEYFMGVANLSAMRSKDDSSQVGACIVNEKNRIVGIGYNGFPIGCSDDVLPWEKSDDFVNSKYAYVVHAEANAILNSAVDLSESRIYVTLYPCNECAKLIIQSGIREVIYLEHKYPEQPIFKASKRLFDLAGVKVRKLENYSLKVSKS
jgi:dCMP deaminase